MSHRGGGKRINVPMSVPIIGNGQHQEPRQMRMVLVTQGGPHAVPVVSPQLIPLDENTLGVVSFGGMTVLEQLAMAFYAVNPSRSPDFCAKAAHDVQLACRKFERELAEKAMAEAKKAQEQETGIVLPELPS